MSAVPFSVMFFERINLTFRKKGSEKRVFRLVHHTGQVLVQKVCVLLDESGDIVGDRASIMFDPKKCFDIIHMSLGFVCWSFPYLNE